MMTKNLIYLLLLFLPLWSCTKEEPTDEAPKEEGSIPVDPEEETLPTIYIGGYSNEITHIGEVIWKNQKPLDMYHPNMLTAGYVRYGRAVYDLDVTIKGNTIYGCGYEKSANRYTAVMGKIKEDKVETVKLSQGTADAQA